MATPKKDWKREWEQTAAKARKLAKRANQRMVRLERYAKKPGYSSITKYAYARAQEYIKNFIDTEERLAVKKKKNPRFIENVKLDPKIKGDDAEEVFKKNVQKIRMDIKALEEFLGSESSTLGESRSGSKTKGIKAIYDKRAQTITDEFLKKHNLSMDANDLKRFFDSKKQAKLEKEYGSRQMFIIAAIIKKENIRGSRKELEEYVKTHVEVNDPKELNMKKTESRAQYLERMRDKLNYTKDPVLNDIITNALQDGFSASNLFI